MFLEFIVFRVGWKNIVCYNFLLYECFVKGEVVINGKSCFWYIYLVYIVWFSKGDF